MNAAMVGILAQHAMQTISNVCTSPRRVDRLHPRILCSLKAHGSSDFPCIAGSSGRLYVSSLRASASSVSQGGNEPTLALGGGGNGAGLHGGGSYGGGGGGDPFYGREEHEGGTSGGLLGAFWSGWQARVKADPQFAFKVLMEEVIGVGACVLGDMASRPNFGLDELDFVFSTVVVGSILNFTLMYMLAPTAAAGAVSSCLPGIFASCPAGHMFEPGNFSLLDRTGTFLYKGGQFAVVGFAAGIVGTILSNVLLSVRKKMDPNFVMQNDAPPTVLNATTWALHMGLSSNARYQTLNGLEFSLARWLHPTVFKTSVFVLRGLNNVVGGVSFVTLARLTGSQKATTPPTPPQVGREDESLLALQEETS